MAHLIDPSNWQPLRRLRSDYKSDLLKLVARFFPKRLGDYHEFLDRLATLITDPEFAAQAESIAQRMVRTAVKVNAQSWRIAAARSSQGRIIYEALRQELRSPVGRRVTALVDENSRLISSLPSEIAKRTGRYVAKRQIEGARSEQIAIELQKRLPQLTKSRIELISRTEVGKAEAAVTRARAQNLGLNHYVWESSQDERVRKSHRAMQGIICSFDDPPSPEALIGQKSQGNYAPGEIYNCFPGDCPVYSPSGIKTLWRAPYSGDIITIHTETGHVFRATPNHPILSDNGWIAAGSINVGSNLIHLRGRGDAFVKPQMDNGISTFEDVFNAASLRGHHSSGFGFDFHGDVIHNDVDQVTVNDNLWLNWHPRVSKHLGTFELAGAERRMRDAVSSIALHIGESSSASFAKQVLPLCGRELAHSDEISIRTTAWRYAVEEKVLSNCDSADLQMERNPLLAPSFFEIKSSKVFRIDDMPDSHGVVGRLDLLSESGDGECISQSVSGTLDSFAESHKTFSGEYGAVRITKKIVSKYSGHVYTLESGNGWYCVSPLQVIAKNCRCLALPLVTVNEVGWPHRVFWNNKVQVMTKSQFAQMFGAKAVA